MAVKTINNVLILRPINHLFLPALLVFILSTFGSEVSGQDSSWIYGKWKIGSMDFVSPPPMNELQDLIKHCRNGELTITKCRFIFNRSGCFLLRSMDNFRVTKQYTLSIDDSSLNINYAPATIDYLFDGGKRKVIKACKTNYTFKSNEGDVPGLEIFIVDKNHLIVNQDDNILFLTKERKKVK